MAQKRFAAVVVGSFETELGIYESDERRGLRRIDNLRQRIPLGADTYRTGSIGRENAEELVEVLKGFAASVREYRCQTVTAVATSAMREAENAALILDRIKVHTGFNVQVISNAELRLMSCKALAARGKTFEDLIREGTAIVDLGFGSMQVTLYDKGRMIGTQNLPLGTLRIREALGNLTSARDERTRILSEMVDHELEIYGNLHLADRKIRNVIAVGDLIRILFDRLMRQAGKDPVKENLVGRKTLLEGCRQILELPDMEMEDRLGVSSETASVMVPAAIIYTRVSGLLKPEQLWFPGTKLVDGVAADYAFSRKLIRNPHDFTGDVISAVEEIARRYGELTPHRRYCLETTLKIFEALKKHQGFTERDRVLLQIASLLHHCGRFINMGRPGTTSYEIIRATEIVGLSEEDHSLVCAVLKIGSERPNLKTVPMKAAKFSAVIRLADALDRSSRQKAGNLKVRLEDEERLTVYAGAAEDLTLERLSFERNSGLFRELFGIEPVFRQKRKF